MRKNPTMTPPTLPDPLETFTQVQGNGSTQPNALMVSAEFEQCVRQGWNASMASMAKERRVFALQLAAWQGDRARVQAELDHCDPREDGCRALKWAAERGHADVVDLLLPVSEPVHHTGAIIMSAVQQTHLDVLKTIVAFCVANKLGLSGGANCPLLEAVFLSRSDMVEVLLRMPGVKGSERCTESIKEAILRRRNNVIALLAPHMAPAVLNATWDSLVDMNKDTPYVLDPLVPWAEESRVRNMVRTTIGMYTQKSDCTPDRIPNGLARVNAWDLEQRLSSAIADSHVPEQKISRLRM